jgi:hypothetical protein
VTREPIEQREVHQIPNARVLPVAQPPTRAAACRESPFARREGVVVGELLFRLKQSGTNHRIRCRTSINFHWSDVLVLLPADENNRRVSR